MKSGMASWTFMFNSSMLWSAGLGWLIGVSLVNLQDTMMHKGPGIVHHGDGEHGPEWSEKVSESEYKNYNYTMNGMMLGIGLLFWYILAKTARNEAATTRAKEEYLEAQIRALAAYNHAFASAVDQATCERAAGEAQQSAVFRDAKAAQDLAAGAYYDARAAQKRAFWPYEE